MNLNQVTVYTDKITESIEFYKSLGLEIIVDSAPRYVRFACPDGGATFSLHETENASECANIVFVFRMRRFGRESRRPEKFRRAV